jgi:hypothetical protein
MDKTKLWNNGGPAFPAQEKIDYPTASVMEYHQGMSLWDWYAGQALITLVQNHVKGLISNGNETDIAKRAGEFADAMIAERNRR